MDKIALGVATDKRYQIFTLTVNPNGNQFRARVELRYLNEPQLWYLSIFDAASGESYCRYVPLIASYRYLNDLMKPFQHKNIGSIYCVPAVVSPSSTDPGLNNLGEFEIVWGDTDDS